MTIAVYGATGYTGRLVVAELTRRKADVLLMGRDEAALRALPGDHRFRVAGLDDHGALVSALSGCAAVVSCVTPFTLFGAPVLAAAIESRCRYLDTSGEQRWVRRVFEQFGAEAEAAGVTLLPAATDDGVAGDLIAGLVAARLPDIDTLTIHHGIFDAGMSRGSMRSFTEIAASAPLVWSDGAWRDADPVAVEPAQFPGDEGEQPSWLLAGPELLAVQRHVPARLIRSTINMDLAAGMSGLTSDIIDAAPVGPSDAERAASRFVMLARGSARDGRAVVGHVTGNDIYGVTAIIAAKAALRIAEGVPPAGARAPSELFDASSFLDALAPFGVRWAVGTVGTATVRET